MREFFISDCHFGSHDQEVIDIALQVIKDIKPNILWLGGDIMDNRAVSPFPGKPKDLTSWKSGKQAAIDGITQLRKAAPKADAFFKEGNHDAWVTKYITRYAPALDEEESLSLPRLLTLRDLDIQFVPETKFTRIGRLLHLHGHEKSIGFTFPAKQLFDRFGTTLICGHFHKFQYHGARTLERADGVTHGVWVIGCSQKIDNVSYDKWPAWEQGFAVIDYTKNGLFHVSPIIVIYDEKAKQKCAIFEGKQYTAKGIKKL